MKRFLCILVFLLALVLVLIGCSSNSSTSTNSPSPKTSATSASVATTPPVANSSTTTTTAIAPLTSSPSATKPANTTTPQTSSANYGGTLRFIQPNAPGTPIGWMPETAGASVITMQVVMEYPLQEDLNGDIRPNLATSYDLNSDPKTPSITLHLRKGVNFHDGTDFNAQAVKWNFEQVKATPLNASTTSYWKSFEVLDDYTIKINLTQWQNRQLRSFGNPTSIICSPAAYEKNGLDWMRWHMVGTGAFVQTDFQKDVTLKTKKNTEYWDTGKPYLDGFQLLYVVDELTRLALFKSGGAEIVDLAGNARVASELQSAGYQIITRPSGTDMLIPDSANADSPWSNIKVRQAAEYAIDKESLVKALGYGFQRSAYEMPSPDSKAYIPELAGRKYDVSKAKQLLSEAGFPNGFKTKIIAQTTANRDIVVALQSYLGKIGLQVDLEFVDAAKFQAYQTGTWNNGLIYTNIIHYPNYNAVLAQWFGVPSSWFKSMKRPEGWENTVTASITSLNQESALEQKCVQALYDDVTTIPLDYGTSLWAVTDKVHDSGVGTRGSSTQWNSQNAWLSK
jgi:peptide/nickel transport system substrate-binding protein